MYNYNRMDLFLNKISRIIQENPNLDLNKYNFVYSELIKTGVSDEDKFFDISSMNYFNEWIEYFKNKRNIDCFCDESWPYFCQFINYNGINNFPKDFIKVYIPLDSKHLYEGAKEIFSFLERENICHESKIGKEIRFDDIVIRLTNKKDAVKLANFVKNSAYIQKGLIPANPFAFSKDNLAYAVDGRLSYNLTISTLISLYIMSKQEKNELNYVNAKDFYMFIKNYYLSVIVAKDKDKLIRDFKIKPNKQGKSRFQNYDEVIKLIIDSFSTDFTFEDYIHHYDKCNNDEYDKVIHLLTEITEVMFKKYGTGAMKNLSKYVENDDNIAITRDNNLREQAEKIDLSKKVKKILENQNIKFLELIESIKTKVKKVQEEKSINLNQSDGPKELINEVDTEIAKINSEMLKVYAKKIGKTTSNIKGADLKNFDTEILSFEEIRMIISEKESILQTLQMQKSPENVKKIEDISMDIKWYKLKLRKELIKSKKNRLKYTNLTIDRMSESKNACEEIEYSNEKHQKK